MPKYYKVFVAVIVVILLLWFVLGFLVPLAVFKDLDLSGKFGDSFGPVNALFSGLAFLGLIYTIIQQIEIFKEQKAQERLTLYLGLLSEVKEDINNLEGFGLKGLDFISRFKVKLLDSTSVQLGQFDLYLIFFSSACTQMQYVILALRNEKSIDESEVYLIKTKIILTYYTYFSALDEEIESTDCDHSYFRMLKVSLMELHKDIEVLMKETIKPG